MRQQIFDFKIASDLEFVGKPNHDKYERELKGKISSVEFSSIIQFYLYYDRLQQRRIRL